MSKRKLTQNQTRRIQSNNAKALHRHKKKEVEWQDDMLGESQDGVVVTRYSVHADVENAQGEIFRCNLRRTLSSLVVGDKVIWRQGNEQLQGVSGVIEAIHPRQNEIARPDYYDGLKRWVPKGASPICGNSIAQDKRFLYKYMPDLADYFHYRHVDVSTLKELASRWKPEILDGFKKSNTHLALDDIRESIKELAYYREHFINLG